MVSEITWMGHHADLLYSLNKVSNFPPQGLGALSNSLGSLIPLVSETKNQYKFVVPFFGAAYATPNKGITILY